MNWNVITTEAAYRKAAKRAMEIFQAEEGTPEAGELALLLVVIKDYEHRHVSVPGVNPVEVIKWKAAVPGVKG